MGAHIKGAEKLRAAWTEDFKMFPDYSISHSEYLPMETRWQCLEKLRACWRTGDSVAYWIGGLARNKQRIIHCKYGIVFRDEARAV
jgi:hypothetical protein